MFEEALNLPVDGNRDRNRAFWLKFLYARKADLTNRDWNLASRLASEWDTCACGSMDDGIPRSGSCPDDNVLEKLGYKFLDIVQKRNITEARQCFEAIQARAAEILRKARSTLFDV